LVDTANEVAMLDGELATIREHLQRYRAVTLQSLERTPPDRLHWAPSLGLMTFAGQYHHLAAIERLYIRGLCQGDWKPEANMLDIPEGVEALKSNLLDARSETLTWLDSLSPSSLDELRIVPWIPVKWTLRSWLWYIIEHEMHHKAQVAMYLHMCDVEAPFFAFVLPAGVRPDKRPPVAPK
jgi:uncharacterized damage-inducible protein DinB